MNYLSKLWTISRRELASYFQSPVAYVFIIIFLMLCGFFTFMVGNFFARNEASLASFFLWHPWLYLFLVPAAGMRLWAEERRSGSIELLLTLPVTPSQAILGKFLAAWLFLGLALLLTFPIIATVVYLGDPDGGVMATGYFGSFLVIGAYLSITSMTSAMTRNQVVSFITSVVVCLFLILAGWPPVTNMLVNWAPGWVVQGVASCSVIPHFDGLQRGVVDTRDLVYFLSVICFSLFTTGVILRNHRAG
ncbi:MAG: ABC transporter permease subunit [Lentisphaerae bacterium]|jgi:ABC-2 type transport system permease protein|nr:ABC transporter permease subunit [Lentisphaerota bacterium]MBT5608094.1 ABC transporter permease subunit [Lentisphaerota bacterium]MBT7060629.1 ABC transporter permease subunit [Lentisphaerota bacterium]MBT7847728.1 ABC transporter permease subunit [Lentisphaerota bacterium]